MGPGREGRASIVKKAMTLVYEVGDGRQVGNIMTSIWDAYEVAHTL